MHLDTIKPMDIERRSFEIISEKLKGKPLKKGTEDIVKRVIHTSADFDYADNLIFSENVVEKVTSALRKGATVVTDTNMAFSGINKKIITQLGGNVKCFMSDKDVADEAKKRGITRAIISMEKAAKLEGDIIFAIGNAPTALIRICELFNEGKINPIAVIGVPVGFVNVIESKEMILNSNMEYIVSKGNKGGSTIAVAIMNALIYKIKR